MQHGLVAHHGHAHLHHGPTTAVNVVLVTDEVAQAIDQQHVLVVARAVAHLHGLHHMRVAADDEVHALVHEEVGQRALALHGFELVLYAPVEAHAYHLRATAACQCNVGSDARAVNEVHHHATLHGNAIGAIGVGEEGKAHALYRGDERHLLLPGGIVHIGADVRNSQRVERSNGALEATVATVKAVVVGGEKQVETRLAQLLGITVGGTECWIASIRRAAKRTLQIHHGIVGPRDVRLDVCKTTCVVVTAIGLTGSRELRSVLHRIAHKHEVHLVVALQQRHQRQEKNRQQTTAHHVCMCEML